MTVPIRRTPYLQQTRRFEGERIEDDVTKAYSEIAFAVNERSIGIFDKFMLVNGDRWFNNDEPQERRQAYRQTYEFLNVSASDSFPHGLSFLDMVVRIFGTAETDTLFIPLPYVNPTASDQIGITVDDTNINFIFGGTAPTLIRAWITLEFLLKTT